MSLWSQSIGGLIINFGVAEFLTLRCIEVIKGESEAIRIRKKRLSDRITIAKEAIEESSLSEEKKKESNEIWDEISKLSKKRNRIAHNPLVQGIDSNTDELVFSVIDLDRMTPNGKNVLEPLHYSEISTIALRVREITRRLSTIIETIPSDQNPRAQQGGI